MAFVQGLHIVSIEKMLFKTYCLSTHLAMCADFIYDVQNNRVIKNRYTNNLDIIKDNMRRIKNRKDIPYFQDVIDNKDIDNILKIKTYLRYKYDRRVGIYNV